jgi:addiction module RelB/DinJ family antitoxin
MATTTRTTSRTPAAKARQKTLLTVKVDKKLKAQAQKTAEQVGLPLGTVMNGFLRQFVMDKRITFEVPLTPTPHLKKVLREAEREKLEDAVRHEDFEW